MRLRDHRFQADKCGGNGVNNVRASCREQSALSQKHLYRYRWCASMTTRRVVRRKEDRKTVLHHIHRRGKVVLHRAIPVHDLGRVATNDRAGAVGERRVQKHRLVVVPVVRAVPWVGARAGLRVGAQCRLSRLRTLVARQG